MCFFFFNQKTAYEMRISDWSSECALPIFDAGTDDIAQHPFGKETGAIPQRERHEDEPGQAGQLELEDPDEHLYCEDEEGENDEQPSDQQHRARQAILEESRKAEILVYLLQPRPRGGKPRSSTPARTDKVAGL